MCFVKERASFPLPSRTRTICAPRTSEPELVKFVFCNNTLRQNDFKAPSTLIRIFFDLQLFLCGFSYLSHLSVNPVHESKPFLIRSLQWKFFNTLWIGNRVGVKSGYFFIRWRNKIEPSSFTLDISNYVLRAWQVELIYFKATVYSLSVLLCQSSSIQCPTLIIMIIQVLLLEFYFQSINLSVDAL